MFKDMKKLMYKLLIICMIIVTFFTYLTQSISYATTSGSSAIVEDATTSGSSSTVEAKENIEKAPEVGDLNVEKNPMIQPKDRVSIGRTERADQIKNTDADLKEGSKQRGSSGDIISLALNIITIFVVSIFAKPILIGAVIISIIATINTNQKYIEAYEKGEAARKKDNKEENVGDTSFQNFIVKYLFTLDKLFFGDFKFLDINIFNINTSKENNSRGNEANANLKKGVAVWTNATRAFAVAISLLLFILGAVMLMINSTRTDKKATSIASLKNFLTDTIKGLMIALLIPIILAMILFAHDIIINIFNAIRYKMLESGAQSAEVIIYKNIISTKMVKGYGYSVSFIAYLFMSAYHIKFLIIYINRLLTIGFLIVVSPIISVTYALDKIGDGKSQVLSNFFKEFVDAVIVGLIYPILYLVYIYALSPITASSPLLSLFVITQFSRAEKTIKGMLNLRKLTTIRSSNSSLDMRV